MYAVDEANTLSARGARWTAGLRYEHLPAAVVEQAKRLLLDTLAVAWAGSSASGVAPVSVLFRGTGGSEEAADWLSGTRMPAQAACLVNGLHASALDFDSVHDEATVHADIVVLPAALALAERGSLSGRDLIVAHVAGDEILVRLGLSVRQHPGWFYSSVLGVFAAAAASASVLGLDAIGARRALGVALSRAAGTQQTLLERSSTKRLQSAFAARDGMEAALLAEVGVTAPVSAFEGMNGFEALYVGLDRDVVLRDLGSDFRFTLLTLKRYPSCFCNYAAIEAALELVTHHGLSADEVEQATAIVTPFMARLVGNPFLPGDSPQVAAQFSVQYSVAAAILRGRFDVRDIAPSAVTESRVMSLVERIAIEIDGEQPGKFTPATVRVRTRDGRELSATVTTLPGTPRRPMSKGELHAKALGCFAGGVRPMSETRARPDRANRSVGRVFERASTLGALNQWHTALIREAVQASDTGTLLERTTGFARELSTKELQ